MVVWILQKSMIQDWLKLTLRAWAPHLNVSDVLTALPSLWPYFLCFNSPNTHRKNKILFSTQTICICCTALPTCMSVESSKRTNLSDILHPTVHLLGCFSQQVKDACGGFDHEQVLILILTFGGPHLCLDGYLTFLKVNDSDGFTGALAAVVFQNVRIPAHPTPPQNKPSLSPWLRKMRRWLD